MNFITKTKHFTEPNLLLIALSCLFFIQFLNNGVQLNIGMSQGESEYNKTFYTNSQLSAENGTLTLNTGNDANISGANLLAKNVALNVGNNLNIESKQTEEDFSSSGFGFNFGVGVGVGAGGNGGNVGGGFNMSSADMHRLWVDDITTIKGTESMTVNVGRDLNLTGAAILSDNLALAVTCDTNKKELQDSYYSESMGFGLSTSIAVGGNQATVSGTGGKPNSTPGGSTSISGSYAQNESSRSVYATIGGLNSTLTSATKDVTGGDFEGSLTIDHRLFSEAGRNQIGKELNYSKNLAVTPFTAASGAYNSKEDNKTEKFFQAVSGATIVNTRLLLNQNITAQQLAGDTTLVAYEGDSLSADSKARDRNAFYDSNTDTAALNSSYTAGKSDNVVAGKIAHEAIGHKVGGESEFVAGFVENTVKNNWGDFQSGNTSFQLTLPQASIPNNNYASGVSFALGSGVYSDVAFVFEKSRDSRNPYGHMSALYQNPDRQWEKYDQGMLEEDRSIAATEGIFPNKAYRADVSIIAIDRDPDIFSQALIDNPNVVYVRTTPEQDKKIWEAAHISQLNPGTYRICTSNCVDAVQNIFSAGNVSYPIDFHPAPSAYFEKLKSYYPNNKTNESYDR